MPTVAGLAAGGILVCLCLYALTGGADFGAGIWALTNRGPRADARRRLIVGAMGPVWETNHIWVVVAVVILFAGFPKAYALVSTALFVPLTLVLAGIVVRGSAFAFHAHRVHDRGEAGRWGSVFAGASLITPFLLGDVLGAVSTGRIRAAEAPLTESSGAWLAPFPLSVGMLTLACSAYLAAVYLTLETEDGRLADDFRSRALGSLAFVSLLSVAVPLLSRGGAPEFQRALLGGRFAVLAAANGLAALGAAAALLLRAFRPARMCAAAQIVVLLAGWGLAQYPYLVRPELTIAEGAASPGMLRLLLTVLAAGGALLFPAILLLFRVFKREAFRRRRPPGYG
jgi:cytochrome d ubiquinol oxidase subunit II